MAFGYFYYNLSTSSNAHCGDLADKYVLGALAFACITVMMSVGGARGCTVFTLIAFVFLFLKLKKCEGSPIVIVYMLGLAIAFFFIAM
jgi:hypothetical protein